MPAALHRIIIILALLLYLSDIASKLMDWHGPIFTENGGALDLDDMAALDKASAVFDLHVDARISTESALPADSLKVSLKSVLPELIAGVARESGLPARLVPVLMSIQTTEFEGVYASRLQDLSLIHCRELYHSRASLLNRAVNDTSAEAPSPEVKEEEEELDFMITAPLDSVIEDFEASLSEDLLCNRRVTCVKNWTTPWSATSDTSNGPVAVEYMSDPSSETTASHCDICVVTVPLGVLKANAITFEPRLEDATPAVADAIAALGFGNSAKVFALFEERWWAPMKAFTLAPSIPDDSKWLEETESKGIDSSFTKEAKEPLLSYWIDVTDLCGQPVLCAMAGASNSPEVEALVAASAAAQDGDALLRRFVDSSLRSAKASGGIPLG